MDALSGLLGGPRSGGLFLLRAMLAPPWSLRVEDQAPLTVLVLLRGEAWVVPASGERGRVGPGDIAILRGPAPYLVADDPDTRPQYVVHPGGHTTRIDGSDACGQLDLGTRTWGTAPDGPVRMLVGTYPVTAAVSAGLLRALPELAVLRDDAWDSPLPALLETEIGTDAPGQEVVLDRLFDLLTVAALRAWLARPGTEPPAWYRAHGDPVVGPALRMMHGDPAQPWTVELLAQRTGRSRAALARRFCALVGEPPMTYLTRWRLDLAADLLRDTEMPLDAVARRVGYGTGFAFSTAFKRVRGITPQDLRNRTAPDGGSPRAVSHGTGGRPPRAARLARGAGERPARRDENGAATVDVRDPRPRQRP